MRSSDPTAPPDLVPRADHCAITVLEGMPGAGKTSLLTALAAAGHATLGEYTSPDGSTTALAAHPGLGDDDAHLANWTRKCAQLRGRSTAIWVDRDWLTALAWGATTSILTIRANWAHSHLLAGRLVLPDRWVILDLPPAASLTRRRDVLDPAHPWSNPHNLRRLHMFYRDPAAALARAHPALASLVASIPLTVLDATMSVDQLVATVTAAATSSISTR